jgi:SAM-dependent methyltransferase
MVPDGIGSGGSSAGGALSRVSSAGDPLQGSAVAGTEDLPAGGTLVLVDMVPELLAAAEAVVAAAAGVDGAVRVLTTLADIAGPARFAELPDADLVWASNVTHHLPDQREAIATLVRRLAPGGCLALSEGGLSMRCLPWDVGVGEPGLQDRLVAAQGTWFHRMRTEMPGVMRIKASPSI